MENGEWEDLERAFLAGGYSYGVALARLMQRVELEKRKTVYGAGQVLDNTLEVRQDPERVPWVDCGAVRVGSW